MTDSVRFVSAASADGVAALADAPGLVQPEPEAGLPPGPDARWLLLSRNTLVTGRWSLWWRQTPPVPGQRVGFIGHYAATDAAAGVALLGHACADLAGHGCTLAIGPVDGSTWRRYRLVTDRSPEPPFLLEPDHPADWPAHFEASGFHPLARYSSAVATELEREEPAVGRIAGRLSDSGVIIRPLDLSQFEDELLRVHAVTADAFQKHLLYSPVDAAEFVAEYGPFRDLLVPDLVLLAEQDDRPVGFAFALPDWLEARRGGPVTTAILKTLAVRPGRAYAGLGHVLGCRVQAAARRLGYRRVIHALMHDGNTSRSLSRRYARRFRGYTLFARAL